jgi:hypothetical protein
MYETHQTTTWRCHKLDRALIVVGHGVATVTATIRCRVVVAIDAANVAKAHRLVEPVDSEVVAAATGWKRVIGSGGSTGCRGHIANTAGG